MLAPYDYVTLSLAYEDLLHKHQEALAVIDALAKSYEDDNSVDFLGSDVADNLRDIQQILAKDRL